MGLGFEVVDLESLSVENVAFVNGESGVFYMTREGHCR